MRLAQGTPRWLGVLWGLSILALVGGRTRQRTFSVAAVPALATWFFRDPRREVAAAPFVAAADGVVRAFERRADGRTRVTTYLSLLDVHVTRSPVAGTIASVERRVGGWARAFTEEAERNEQVAWSIRSPVGDVEVVQIAGVLARRIIPYVPAGAAVGRGDRIGLIRFGSRVDVYLPAGVESAVERGQRVHAGATPLARVVRG